jgi:hypothetical protein
MLYFMLIACALTIMMMGGKIYKIKSLSTDVLHHVPRNYRLRRTKVRKKREEKNFFV